MSSQDHSESMDVESAAPQNGSASISTKPSAPPKKPKFRIRLSLKLPTQANNKSKENADGESKPEESPISAAAKAKTRAKPAKRRNLNPTKALKIPPIHSPGLLMFPPNSGGQQRLSFAVNPHGLTTASEVFDQTMEAAGYTYENRSQTPHRGSSVQRTVGDMFDCNVKLALHFPSLVPPDLLKEQPDIVEKMIDNLKQKKESQHEESVALTTSKKRARPWSFDEMIPISLKVPLPERYVQQKVKYVKAVEEREKAIVAFQEAEELAELEPTANPPEVATIPVIPVVPDPPRLSETDWDRKDEYDDTEHPLYKLRGKEHFVRHLDKDAFHITQGRYFGLLSNEIADPNYVGANAPGISGVNVSGGAGLATSTTSASTATMSLALTSSSFKEVSGSALSGPTKRTLLDVVRANPSSVNSRPSIESEIEPRTSNGSEGSSLIPTASMMDLKRLMESEEDTLQHSELQLCIIQTAVVSSSRGDQGGVPFRAPNGQVYPDVSKAFSHYSGLKPCERCKSNKQGSFHCRIRRKHKDLDFDGGNSVNILSALFAMQESTAGGEE